MIVLAQITDENGRPSRVLIPPRSTARINTDYKWTGNVYCTPLLVKRCLFVVNLDYQPNDTFLWIFNGGFENQWILHGDIVAVSK
jgi:hypothetical protein